MRKYLKLTRAHTAPLEAVPAIIGAALAIGTLWSYEVALWGFIGVMYHLAGYGMNSLRDWEKGFDKYDPNKQHHPLNTGHLSTREANIAVAVLFTLTAVLTVKEAVTSQSPAGAMLLVIVAVIAGISYNEIGKLTKHKYIFISIAHSMLFAIPYTALGGQNNLILLFGTLAVFMWVVFQISISGELKDITQDSEKNLLRTMGITVVYDNLSGQDILHNTRKASVAAGVQRAVLTIICIAFSLMISGHGVVVIAVGIIGALSTIHSQIMLIPSGYDRDTRVLHMSLIELSSLVMFTLAATNVIGLKGLAAVLIGSFVWLVFFNYLEWGTFISPEV